MSTDLTLIIMAAGLGSRFGGDKQLANLGPNGETILELSLESAYRAGFRRAVLVIRPELEVTLKARLIRARQTGTLAEDFDYQFCYQKLDDLPLNIDISRRRKPWGTAHALYSARALVKGDMAVINADDYYGDSAFESLVTGLRNGHEWLMVAYPISLTLSEYGGVNRGICKVENGQLKSVAEWLDIHQQAGLLKGYFNGKCQTIADDALVSMTCWGFRANIFQYLTQALETFASTSARQENTECFLPTVVQDAIKQGQKVNVLTAQDHWLGVTYPQDIAWVKTKLTELD